MLKFFIRGLALLVVAAVVTGYFFASFFRTEWQVLSGRQAFQRGDFQIAIEHLSPAVKDLEERGSSARVVYWRRVLAQAHLAMRQDDDAVRHYRRLDDSKAHFALGLRALQKGEMNDSIALLARAVEMEPDCTVCKAALVSATSADGAYRESANAGDVQSKALEEMKAPIACLGYLAVASAGSALTSGVFQPRLVALVRRAGASKVAAERAIWLLSKWLTTELEGIRPLVVKDVCPPLSENETIKTALEWGELAPFGSDAHRALVAAFQAAQLAKLVGGYAQALVVESDAGKQLATANGLGTAHWDIFTTASKNPKFIELGLDSLTMPATPPRGWGSRMWDMVYPGNWLSK